MERVLAPSLERALLYISEWSDIQGLIWALSRSLLLSCGLILPRGAAEECEWTLSPNLERILSMFECERVLVSRFELLLSRVVVKRVFFSTFGTLERALRALSRLGTLLSRFDCERMLVSRFELELILD